MEASDFFVEEFLDLTNNNGEDDVMTDAFFDSVAAHSTDSSTLTTPVDSSHSSASFPDHFSGELCVPFDDVAELEWLSNFVEDSFSSEDLHKYHHHIPVTHNPVGPAQFHNQARQLNPNPTQPSSTVPGKARSKRSRVAPCDWSTRLVMVAPTTTTSPATSSSDTTTTNPSPSPAQKKISSKRRDNSNGNGEENPNGEVRRCLHCAAEKTPQWRTGPMGPKTLCNACGVRYKSGRLVPEYRPAASPTFISAKHSNSHRKVIELRRQKDMQRQQQHQMIGHHHHHHQQHQHHMMMGVSSNGGDDYLIHHHLGHDYRQMI